jgi:hypothetical protein
MLNKPTLNHFMRPVQRIMKYPLLLMEIKKKAAKAGTLCVWNACSLGSLTTRMSCPRDLTPHSPSIGLYRARSRGRCHGRRRTCHHCGCLGHCNRAGQRRQHKYEQANRAHEQAGYLRPTTRDFLPCQARRGVGGRVTVGATQESIPEPWTKNDVTVPERRGSVDCQAVEEADQDYPTRRSHYPPIGPPGESCSPSRLRLWWGRKRRYITRSVTTAQTRIGPTVRVLGSSSGIVCNRGGLPLSFPLCISQRRRSFMPQDLDREREVL